ncbi:unnamed protein product [Symbiodinium sp. KB8]|nr:unnamed protein product [Symbiodinium sp. KB8]
MLIHGWTAGALLLDFVESLLEPLQRKPMTIQDMCDDLGAKAGPLQALLRTCQILNYVSLDKSTGAYAAVPGLELEELQSVLRSLSVLFAFAFPAPFRNSTVVVAYLWRLGDTVRPVGESETCYAHAIASAAHSALLRIVGRDSGYPDFQDIRDDITRKFEARDHRPERDVLRYVCRKYGLRFRRAPSPEAREAVREGRAVVACFDLSARGWYNFEDFFLRRRRGILQRKHIHRPLCPGEDLLHDAPEGHVVASINDDDDDALFDINDDDDDVLFDAGGHAVTYVRDDDNYMTLMNSWGPDWGDRGFFKIAGPWVLHEKPDARMQFFEVFWYQDDRSEQEQGTVSLGATKTGRSGLNVYPQSRLKVLRKRPTGSGLAKALRSVYEQAVPPFRLPSEAAEHCLVVWAEHRPSWRNSRSEVLPILLDGIVLEEEEEEEEDDDTRDAYGFTGGDDTYPFDDGVAGAKFAMPSHGDTVDKDSFAVLAFGS